MKGNYLHIGCYCESQKNKGPYGDLETEGRII
jgi:hypothetical protein